MYCMHYKVLPMASNTTDSVTGIAMVAGLLAIRATCANITITTNLKAITCSVGRVLLRALSCNGDEVTSRE